MRKTIAGLLIAAAVFVGLFLPTLVFAVQDRSVRADEPAEIQQVNLSADSGLQLPEKFGLLSNAEAVRTEIGVGRNQTPGTLSTLSWKLIGQITSAGCPILDSATAMQTEQSATLVSHGDQAFIYWHVLFTDDLGNYVNILFDDETGMPLGISFSGENMQYSPTDEWASIALQCIVDLNGLTISDVKGEVNQQNVEPQNDKEMSAEQKEAIAVAAYPYGELIVALYNEETACEIAVYIDNGCFDINFRFV